MYLPLPSVKVVVSAYRTGFILSLLTIADLRFPCKLLVCSEFSQSLMCNSCQINSCKSSFTLLLRKSLFQQQLFDALHWYSGIISDRFSCHCCCFPVFLVLVHFVLHRVLAYFQYQKHSTGVLPLYVQGLPGHISTVATTYCYTRTF